MYRIVFTKLCPRKSSLIVEHGPWCPERQVVEGWMKYFHSVGHPADMSIENIFKKRRHFY